MTTETMTLEQALAAELRRLHDENERLRKDAARFCFMADNLYFDGVAWWFEEYCILESDESDKPDRRYVREAIDAAMKAREV